MSGIIENLIGAVLIAIVSAWVTVWLAFRRFRTEKWWERRADAYALIMDSLHHMKRVIQDDLTAIEEQKPQPNGDRCQELRKKAMKAQDVVRKAVDTSSFLLDKKAEAVLKTFMTDIAKAKDDAYIAAARHFDVYDALSGELAAIDSCLQGLASIAKRDLRVG